MDIKLLAFDMDGTLLDGKGGMADINKFALRECERRGIHLLFCSGRSFEVQLDFAAIAGVSPYIASANGSRIDASPKGPIIKEWTFTESDARFVRDTLLDLDLYFAAYARGRTYIFNHASPYRPPQHNHPDSVDYHQGTPYTTILDPVRVANEGATDIYKYVSFSRKNDPLFREAEKRLEGHGYSVTSSWSDNLEVMPSGVDKGSAVRFVADMLGIEKSRIMAFGDHENDIPMLRAAGCPVTMLNSDPTTLKEGKIIAPRHDEGGVGKVICETVLGL